MGGASWFAGKTKRSKKRKRNDGTSFNAGISGPDPETERNPPPDQTPVSFPDYQQLHDGVPWGASSSAPDLRSLFSKVLRPGDISNDHVQALNIQVLPLCSVDEMLPLMVDGTSYIPQLATPASTSEPQAEEKTRQGFDDRLSELQVDNEMAFRIVTRRVDKGVKPPRLAHMRKFWEGLEVMSQYWDCSLDRYWEAAPSNEEERGSTKRPRPASDVFGREERSVKTAFEDRTWPLLASDDSKSGDVDAMSSVELDTGSAPCESNAIPSPDPRDTPEPVSTIRYKGRRISTGRDMPELFRTNTVKAFVEGTIWPFRTSLVAPRVTPIIQFSKLNLPVRQTAAVYRIPNERTKARQGWLTGPILSIQVRPEVEFEAGSVNDTTDKARLDLMRELGELLQIAQERRRQGRSEVKPGEGKWWTTKRRWGGGPGGEVQNDVGNSDIVAPVEEALGSANGQNGARGEGSAGNRKKKGPAILWKEVRCGKGFWDPKIEYEAIGKAARSEYDEIFMVSSLNHHISILKLTIHDSYTDCLTSGTLPEPIPIEAEWSRPKLQRSRWFDLLDKEQRIEAFRGLWGVMAYMTR